ncbi:two-component sensor histidine kinase [Bacillus sp. FJAT-27264]|uniref:cache domain-containing sensor histidine kinase n=1 Tax=Paenibacillus sp. (strain DSM 101736 / FJAT-27264) TaxID=1850362 RepID=UPI000807ACC7|nr:sensor histidine kinase [Bacillus sp. FJAT-27264]OBZ09879.1 two-component sensor histidine kinase [Bacillus sp. FJAT-27264]
MQRRFPSSYMPLGYKLLISYLLLVLTPVIGIGSYAYISSVNTIAEHTRSNLEVTVKQVGNNVDYRLKDLIRSSDEIYTDQTLSRYLTGYHSGWEKYNIMSQYILPKLENAANLPNQEVMLSLYVDNPNVSEYYYLSEYYYSDNNSKSAGQGGRKYALFHTQRIQDTQWYQSLDLHFGSAEWKQVDKDKETGSISYLRPLINYDSLQLSGLFKMTVNMKYIFSDVDTGHLGEDSILFIVDDKDHLLFSSSKNQMDPAMLSSAANGDIVKPDSFMEIKTPIDNMSASIVAWVPYSSLKKNSEQVRNVTIWICVLILALLFVISIIMSQYFSRRFMKLTASLKSFQEGNFHKRMPIQGNDEFSEIGSAFNDMASTIQRLIDEVYVSNLEKKETELQVLHSQMNPHFLYNTFSSISRMAKLGEIDKLHEIVRALARFYRLSLHRGDMIIPIEQEIQIVESYLEIQKIKNADRINVTYEIAPEVMEYETVKFILQPFVENALEHAWYDDEISIIIRAYPEGEDICFEVEDNGLGMKEEIIELVLDPTDKGIGYGIRNVDQRIKLQYGKEYGVIINSSLGEGTVIRICFPSRMPGKDTKGEQGLTM